EELQSYATLRPCICARPVDTAGMQGNQARFRANRPSRFLRGVAGARCALHRLLNSVATSTIIAPIQDERPRSQIMNPPRSRTARTRGSKRSALGVQLQ